MGSEDGSFVWKALEQRIRGPVLVDEATLARYSTDQSMYLVRPRAVALPEDIGDIIQVLRFAREEGIPITPRGGGSSTAGSALGRGIVLDLGRNSAMNHLLAFEEVEGTSLVTVEPGLVHDELQRYLRERGLYLPADPSSGAISVIGGNLATKASGPHALKHGSIDRYLHSLQFITLAGELVDTEDSSTIPDRIRAGILSLQEQILADRPTIRRLERRKDSKIASGYNLFTFVRHRQVEQILAQLMVGSVGTLGVVVRATLQAEPFVEGRATTLTYFRNLHEAGEAVLHIKALDVAAIEVMNRTCIAIVRERRRDLEVPDDDVHMLLVEYEGPERHDQIAAVGRLLRRQGYALVGAPVTLEGEAEQAKLWRIRKALLPIVRNYRPGWRALSVVNDVGVDVTHLGDFIRDLEDCFDRLGMTCAIYGHAGSGNLHLRPLFDVNSPDLRAQIARVAEEVYEIVFRYDGTITAEHGMGRLRTPYLSEEWGEQIVGYMRRIKELFDPTDLLNPEVMFSDRALTDDLKPVTQESTAES